MTLPEGIRLHQTGVVLEGIDNGERRLIVLSVHDVLAEAHSLVKADV